MQVFNGTPLDDKCSINIKCCLNIGRLLAGAFDAVHECGELRCYLVVSHRTLVVERSFFFKIDHNCIYKISCYHFTRQCTEPL